MNRSILIVIVDFLLVSLLAFSNLDSLTLEREDRPLQVAPIKVEAGGKQDVVTALKLALDAERSNREKLAADLSQTRESAEGRQNVIAERERRIQQSQEELRRTEAQVQQLEQLRASLQQQTAAAQTNVQSLQTALAATRSEARLSREQLASLQADLKRKQEEGEALRKSLDELARTHSNVVAARQQLDTKLQVAEAEKRLTTEQLASVRSEVQTVRTEKAQLQAHSTKLAEGVSALAEKSGALTQEIRENRALAPNTIFSDFTQQRLQTRFAASRAGALGQEVKKEKNAQTILVSDGAQTYAIYHIAETPLTLWPPGTEWHSLSGVLSRGLASFAITRVLFLEQDPRILAVPVDAAQARQLGGKVYKVAPDPFKFQEAVLVGMNEGYYGECKFQIDLSTPQYVKMDRGVFRGLFGKFNPSRGDLVLSKTGEILGIMVNDEYCAVLGQIKSSATLQCGDALKAQQAGQTLTLLNSRVMALPPKLQ